MSRFKVYLKGGGSELWDDYRVRGAFVEAIRRDSHERVTVPADRVDSIVEYYKGQPGLSFRENKRTDDFRVVD